MQDVIQGQRENPKKVSFTYIKNGTSMLVQFDSYKERVAKGRVQTLYYKHPFEFGSLDQLLMIMEDILDSVGLGMELGGYRSLNGECSGRYPVFQQANPEDSYTDEDLFGRKYENAFSGDLVIRILGRQNYSMQGEIQIGGSQVRFRSSLELLRMLYEYLKERYL